MIRGNTLIVILFWEGNSIGKHIKEGKGFEIKG